jgi:hypothetical protein
VLDNLADQGEPENAANERPNLGVGQHFADEAVEGRA